LKYLKSNISPSIPLEDLKMKNENIINLMLELMEDCCKIDFKERPSFDNIIDRIYNFNHQNLLSKNLILGLKKKLEENFSKKFSYQMVISEKTIENSEFE
jgi:hypothetical protein